MILDEFQKDVFKAKVISLRIDSVSTIELKKFLNNLISNIYILCGMDQDSSTSIVQLNELSSELKKFYKFLTLDELTIAFKKGCKNSYGEYFGLNFKTYVGWIYAYTGEESRAKAIKAIELAKLDLLPKQKVLTQEEKEEILKDGVLKSFESFKSGAIVLDAGNVSYNWLDKNGLIKFTKERKDEIFKQSSDKLKAEIVQNKNRNVSIEIALSHLTNDHFISEAKKMALKIYFSELIETEIELSELILNINL